MLDFYVDAQKCLGEGSCVRDCPRNILILGDDRRPQVLPERAEKCIKCLHCLAVCRPGAISILGYDPDAGIPLANNLPEPEKLEVLIKGKRSVRRFRPEPLDRETIRHLVHTAGHAPTGVNNMAVRYTVLDVPERMLEFREHVMNTLERLIELNRLPQRFEFFRACVNAWHTGKDVIFRDAPHLLVTSSPANSVTPREDSIIGLSYFDLYAASMGIGTLWCGLAKWAVEDIAPELRTLLRIPTEHIIGNVILFGKPAVRYYRTIQRNPEIVFVKALGRD